MSSPSTLLPPVRRVVTGHSTDGSSKVLHDEIVPTRYFSHTSQSSIYTIYVNAHTPARADDELSESTHKDGSTSFSDFSTPHGSVFRVFDYPPSWKSPHHRTNTVDFGTVVQGTLCLELDDGRQVQLGAGDTFVQRATSHAWWNASATEWARVSFVIVGAHIYLQHVLTAADTRAITPKRLAHRSSMDRR